MPDLIQVELSKIVEPAKPVRVGMDEQKMRELQDSMRTQGQINPVTLINRGNYYEIETGHRRWFAARAMGWRTILAIVKTPEESRGLATMLHENLAREDITAAEEALIYEDWMEANGHDEAALCAAVGQSPDYVADRLRLRRGDLEVFRAVLERKIKFAVARELNKFKREDLRRYYLESCVRSGYPARQVARWREEAIVADVESQATVVVEEGVGPHPAAEVFRMACRICGGSLDPWAMVSIIIHNRCLAEILAAIERAAKGE